MTLFEQNRFIHATCENLSWVRCRVSVTSQLNKLSRSVCSVLSNIFVLPPGCQLVEINRQMKRKLNMNLTEKVESVFLKIQHYTAKYA